MKSMTGFAYKSSQINNIPFNIEIKGYNHKNLDIILKTPEYLSNLEIDIRKIISKYIKRGKIILKISNLTNSNPQSVFNSNLFINIKKTIQKIDPDIDVSPILANPIFFNNEIILNDNFPYEKLLNNIEKLLNEFDKSRKIEGKNHLINIKKILKEIEKSFKKIKKLEKKIKKQKKEEFFKRYDEFFKKASHLRDRAFQELIFMLDKIDFSEEIIRFEKHCNYFSMELNSNVTGKKLIFITQEMLREINTLSVKCQDFEISKICVEIKNNIEIIREQLMNIE